MSDRSTLDRDISQHLARMLDHVGRIEGRCLAMRDAIHRELSDEYFSDEFTDGLHEGFAAIRTEAELVFETMEAADESVISGDRDIPEFLADP